MAATPNPREQDRRKDPYAPPPTPRPAKLAIRTAGLAAVVAVAVVACQSQPQVVTSTSCRGDRTGTCWVHVQQGGVHRDIAVTAAEAARCDAGETYPECAEEVLP